MKGLKDKKTRAATYAEEASPLGDQLSEEHENLVTVLALCVDPSAIASLGMDGKFAIDIVNSRLPVVAGA